MFIIIGLIVIIVIFVILWCFFEISARSDEESERILEEYIKNKNKNK